MDRSIDFNRALTLTRQCPAYQPTPLLKIKAPSGHQLLVKDETSRFSMGAFKALGGIYAMAAVLLVRWREENQTDIEPECLFTEEIQTWSRQFTFVCASAGNHGLAVARGAKLFNTGCRIHLADTVPAAFENRLLTLGVTVVRREQTMSRACAQPWQTAANGEILLSDSAWPGYSQIPRW